MIPIRRSFAELGPDQIRQLSDEELDLPITMEDLLGGVEKCNKSVSPDDLEKYNRWMREFGLS